MNGTHFKRKLNDISVMNTVRLLSVYGYTIKVISYLNMFINVFSYKNVSNGATAET